MDAGSIGGISAGNMINNVTQSADKAADDGFARKLEAAVNGNDEKELKKACQEFEAIMLDLMYKSMKSTIIKSDLVEEDPGTAIFESMQDENMMKEASKTGTFGLAESLYRQLSKNYGTGAKNVNQEVIQGSEPASEKKTK